MSEPWYKQNAYGFKELLPKDIRLVEPKKDRTSKRGTAEYQNIVLEAVSDLRAGGFTGRIGADCHRNDPDAYENWVWSYDKLDKFFEYFIVQDMPLAEQSAIAARNKGRGWRFPKLFIYKERRPSPDEREIMARNKVPFVVLTSEDPEDPDPDGEPELDQLDIIIHMLGEILAKME